jgi:hypothetical protein
MRDKLHLAGYWAQLLQTVRKLSGTLRGTQISGPAAAWSTKKRENPSSARLYETRTEFSHSLLGLHTNVDASCRRDFQSQRYKYRLGLQRGFDREGKTERRIERAIEDLERGEITVQTEAMKSMVSYCARARRVSWSRERFRQDPRPCCSRRCELHSRRPPSCPCGPPIRW